MSPTQRNFVLAGGIGIVLLAAACGGDGTGPGNVNPGATAAKLEALDDAFETPTFRSFELAVRYAPAASASLSDLRAALSVVRAGHGTPPAIHVLRHTLDQRRGAGSAMAFPPELLGKTFEWNPTTGTYEVTTRAGAPANGVRFILYALGSGDLPATPLQEIGYVDFKDETTPSAITLHIVVVASGTTYVDYTVSVDTTTFSLTIAGFVSDGTRRLDFSLSVSGSATISSVEITFDINAENAHVRLTSETEALSQTEFRTTLDYRFQFGADVMTLTGITNLNGSAVTGNLTFRLNGRDVATYTLDGAGGQWRGPGGGALSQNDLQAVSAILAAAGNLLLRGVSLLLL
jgi:hypothetical protein